MSERDDLLRQLGSLPVPDPLDDLRAERVRRAAHAALLDEKRLAELPAWTAPVRRAWSRAVMPTLVTGAVGSYLWWALATAASLYR